MKDITFDIEKCKGCELCVISCPKKIIALDTDIINKKGYHPAAVKEKDLCISCAQCALICPHVVITVTK